MVSSVSSKASSYLATERLYLWLLTRPEDPVLVGELDLVRSVQGVSLRYAASWLERRPRLRIQPQAPLPRPPNPTPPSPEESCTAS